jgi:hypothetical protein
MKNLSWAPTLLVLILILLSRGQLISPAALTPCAVQDEEQQLAITLSFDRFATLDIDVEGCRVDSLSHNVVDPGPAIVVEKLNLLQLNPTNRIAVSEAEDAMGNWSPQNQVGYIGTNSLYLQKASLLI